MEVCGEFDDLIKARKGAFKITKPIFILFVLACISNIFFKPLSIFFSLVLFILFYRNIVYAARYPCPKCDQPFGTNSKVVLGIGSHFCQNCNVGLGGINRSGHPKILITDNTLPK